MTYSVVIDEKALQDAQEAIDYYEEQQAGLGGRFEKELNQQITLLEKNPFFRIRYDQIRCLPLKKFPFMLHFTIDESEKIIAVIAIFHTAQHPKKWKKKEFFPPQCLQQK
jgi:plasmid stabilization system protein ParE